MTSKFEGTRVDKVDKGKGGDMDKRIPAYILREFVLPSSGSCRLCIHNPEFTRLDMTHKGLK